MRSPGDEEHRERRGGERRRVGALIVGLIGLALLLAIAFWWASRQTELEAVEPVSVEPTLTTLPATNPPPPEPVASEVRITRVEQTVELRGMVKTESERTALKAAVTNAGLEVEDRMTVSDEVEDSDPRVVAALLGPLLNGAPDGQLELIDGTVVITGEALDPVEAELIIEAINTATAAGLTVDDQTTIRVLPEAVQIEELQKEIDQIFELARAIEGQYPNFETSVEELSAGARTTLDRVAVAMRRYPLPAADIVGHTDSTGSIESNLQLSQDRAQAVTDYLIGVGVDAARLDPVGKGEGEPIADNATSTGRAENRRVDFVVKQRQR